MPSTKSDPPPFSIPRGREKHSLLPDCSAAFAGIESAMKTMTGELRGVRSDVKEMGRSQAAQAESVKGLWHELRDEVKPDIKGLTEKMGSDRQDHERNCPARRRAMRKAETGSDHNIDARSIREELTGDPTGTVRLGGNRFIRNSANGHYEIPRPVLWIAGMIGAAVAASGYVINLLQKL